MYDYELVDIIYFGLRENGLKKGSGLKMNIFFATDFI
jgi:hypothetical protein